MISQKHAYLWNGLFVLLLSLVLSACGGGGSSSSSSGIPAAFVGNYTGTYSGSQDSGTWTGTIDSSGNFTGTATSNTGQGTANLTGKVDASGQLTMTSNDVAFGGSALGSVSQSGALKATWTTTSGQTFIITGSKSGAALSSVNGQVLQGGASGNPVKGSTIVLWQASANGTTTAIQKTTTNTTGNFAMNYTNPGDNSLLYVTAYGGDAGQGSNPQIQMMSALGSASSLSTSSNISLNELTTMAAVIAFGSNYGSSGIQSPTAVELKAFQGMVTSSGAMNSQLTSGSSASATTIELLTAGADSLASCYQATAAASPCLALEQYSNNSSDMFLAALQWVIDPMQVQWAQIFANLNNNAAAQLFDLASYPVSALDQANQIPTLLQTVFQGSSSSSSQLIQPQGLAVDGNCDVWVGSNASSGFLTAIQPSATGSVLTPTTVSGGQLPSLPQPQFLANDDQGNVYVGDNSGVLQFTVNSSSSTLSGVQATIATGGPFMPPSGNSNASPFITSLFFDSALLNSATGGMPVLVTEANPSNTPGGGGVCPDVMTYSSNPCDVVNQPGPAVADQAGNIFVVDAANQDLLQYTATQAFGSNTPALVCKLSTASGPNYSLSGHQINGVAVDANDNSWVAISNNLATQSPGWLVLFKSSQGNASCSAVVFPLTGAANPSALTTDAKGNLWYTDSSSGTLNEIPVSNISNSSAGFTPQIYDWSTGANSTPISVMVDPSGNVWTANNGNNTVSVFFGIASPTGSCNPPSQTLQTLQAPTTESISTTWNPTITPPITTTTSGSGASSGSSSGSSGGGAMWMQYIPTNSYGLMDPFGILG